MSLTQAPIDGHESVDFNMDFLSTVKDINPKSMVEVCAREGALSTGIEQVTGLAEDTSAAACAIIEFGLRSEKPTIGGLRDALLALDTATSLVKAIHTTANDAAVHTGRWFSKRLGRHDKLTLNNAGDDILYDVGASYLSSLRPEMHLTMAIRERDIQLGVMACLRYWDMDIATHRREDSGSMGGVYAGMVVKYIDERFDAEDPNYCIGALEAVRRINEVSRFTRDWSFEIETLQRAARDKIAQATMTQ